MRQYNKEYISMIVIWILVAELALRLIAMGPRRFFRSPWCWFDLCLVAVSLAFRYSGFEAAGSSAGDWVLAARVARFGMLFRVVKDAWMLQRAFKQEERECREAEAAAAVAATRADEILEESGDLDVPEPTTW